MPDEKRLSVGPDSDKLNIIVRNRQEVFIRRESKIVQFSRFVYKRPATGAVLQNADLHTAITRPYSDVTPRRTYRDARDRIAGGRHRGDYSYKDQHARQQSGNPNGPSNMLQSGPREVSATTRLELPETRCESIIRWQSSI